MVCVIGDDFWFSDFFNIKFFNVFIVWGVVNDCVVIVSWLGNFFVDWVF